MKRFDWKRMISLALAACLLLSCAACGKSGGPDEPAATPGQIDQGGTVEAASMWLVKTEGTVSVTDGDGADVSLLDRLGLFSGYGVATQAASYGWIDLDDTKLTKMDENSGVIVQKDGKHLELTVDSGSLFFNVTKPLESDETLDIRSSTMVTAIRGTCGWVSVTDSEHMDVYILEGTVECSVGEVTVPVAAGQTAAIDASASSITTEDFTVADIPEFVLADVTQDEALCAAILDASGLDVLNPGPAGDPALLSGVYFGDPASCAMTAEQAAELAQTLRDVMAEMDQGYDQAYSSTYEEKLGMGHFARLFDAGNGRPALFYVGGGMYDSGYGAYMAYYFTYRVYHIPGDHVEQFGENGQIMAVHDGWVLVGGAAGGDPTYDAAVHDLTGSISPTPSHTAQGDWSQGTFTVDGQPVSEAEFDQWRDTWAPETELYTFAGSDVGAHYNEAGFVPAEDVLAALDAWAGA